MARQLMAPSSMQTPRPTLTRTPWRRPAPAGADRPDPQELADTNETPSDQICTYQSLQGATLKTETEMSSRPGDLDEVMSKAPMSEETAQRAIIVAARQGEQELAQELERGRKVVEVQVMDMQARVDVVLVC
jgi:hypothetical protein